MIKSNADNTALETEMDILQHVIDDKDIKTQEDFFKVNSKKLDALLNATENDLERAEHAILRRTNDRYRKIIFDAQVYANTGAGTVAKAIDMASRNFLSRGIDCIEYKDGKRMNIASYAEMAVRTANKRAVNVSEGEIRKQRGWHLVRISKYGQCSEICLPWQGRIYVDDVYSGGTKEESKQSGYPLLSTAIEGGLFHPNCRHRSTTYFPDLQEDKNSKKFDGEKENKDNAVASKKLDREIQKQRRIEKGSLDEENIKEAEQKKEQWIKSNKKLEITGLSSNDYSHNNTAPIQIIKRGKLTKMDENTKIKVLEAYEKRIVNYDVEHAIVITQLGEVIEVLGDSQNVYIDLLTDTQLKNAYITHNHPKDETEYSFSNRDIQMFINKGLSVLRGVDDLFEYTLDKNFEFSNKDEDYCNWQNFLNMRHAKTVDKCNDLKIRYRRKKK